ncbi:MAG: phospho-sugar mutase [Lachnospiraceae bacterium]|nr:phospho-sugar mutase [Lachnospiraceae bacterium]
MRAGSIFEAELTALSECGEEDEAKKAELNDRFYKELSFGTAGLRGKIGAGSNRMNFHTVGRAAQGIADYINSCGKDAAAKGVVIAHDPRHFSKEFSLLTAHIFAKNGIKAYIFSDMRPTPELAYIIRLLGTVSGVNITASHNPREYNGFKAYWEDGCQVSSKVADGMTECIFNLDYFSHKTSDIIDAFASGKTIGAEDEALITVLGPEYDEKYLQAIESLAIHAGDDLDLSIPLVYTPLNGAGSIPFSRMLKDRGFSNWHIVEEQKDPDPDFTTVGYPNPEAPAAFKMSEELGRKVGAELIMATDPDADRFAIELLGEDGEYVPLNGNQTGYILVNYILEGMKDAGTLPDNGAMVKSIVTSTMSSRMAEAYGVNMYESLTGFKNICGQIPFLEENKKKYLFGYEESVGYAACPDIRDKDGISAGMLVAEAAAYYRKKGKTLWQVLMGLYEKYGYYAEDEPNLILEGEAGAARISRMMEQIRKNPPSEVAGKKVLKVLDYKDGYFYDGKDEDILKNTKSIAPIPGTNALRFFLEEEGDNAGASGGDPDTWFAIRPSGTEPKIKFYFYTRQSSREDALETNKRIREDILSVIESVE